ASWCFATSVSSLLSPSLLFVTLPAPTAIYPLSLHDALPIWRGPRRLPRRRRPGRRRGRLGHVDRLRRGGQALFRGVRGFHSRGRSEEHTSELQSHLNLVCRLLLEKKNQ